MNIVDRYKNQHKIILSLCRALKESAILGVQENEMSSYISVLKTLDEILSTHLESEDSYLYPRLAQDESLTIQTTSKRLHKEMSPITKVYKTYQEKYIVKSNILKEEKKFLKETNSLVNALNKRIEKEEVELYALLS